MLKLLLHKIKAKVTHITHLQCESQSYLMQGTVAEASWLCLHLNPFSTQWEDSSGSVICDYLINTFLRGLQRTTILGLINLPNVHACVHVPWTVPSVLCRLVNSQVVYLTSYVAKKTIKEQYFEFYLVLETWSN